MKAIFLAVLMVVAMGAQAAPNENTGVDCDAVGKAGWSVFTTHHNMNGSAYTEKSMTPTLVAYCVVGVGSYLNGKTFDETMKTTINGVGVTGGSMTAQALLISMAAQGFLLASAHGLEKSGQ